MTFQIIDWIILFAILFGVIGYGVYKGKSSQTLDGYFLGNRKMSWWLIVVSVMGTQASAVTFLTVPGQAYTDGMRFIQFYFGLPIAMVVLCITFVPIYRRLKVYTAYEFLEQRFDKKTRTFISLIFLISRGLSTGISILAPSLILQSLLGWNIYFTTIIMGGLLIIYTVSGGVNAIAYTQQLQFIIIYLSIVLVGWWALRSLPPSIGISNVFKMAGQAGKMNIVTGGIKNGHFDWTDKYNIWSGIAAGFFLQLSYFGTDQSQVGRYLTAETTTGSKLGLLMTGLIKIPLQFFILLIGIFIFVFYEFNAKPVFFDKTRETRLLSSQYANDFKILSTEISSLQASRKELLLSPGSHAGSAYQSELSKLDSSLIAVKGEVGLLEKKADPSFKTNSSDSNYVFLRFVGDNMPSGLVGLIVAVIFLASWGSVSAALCSLASCTMVDIHKPFINKPATALNEVRWSKIYSLFWGLFGIAFAFFAANLGNSLVEAVNILGSWFYGTMLGVFLVAFYLKSVTGTPVFLAAIGSEALIVWLSLGNRISFVWLTVIGAITVIIVSLVIQQIINLRLRLNR